MPALAHGGTRARTSGTAIPSAVIARPRQSSPARSDDSNEDQREPDWKDGQHPPRRNAEGDHTLGGAFDAHEVRAGDHERSGDGDGNAAREDVDAGLPARRKQPGGRQGQQLVAARGENGARECDPECQMLDQHDGPGHASPATQASDDLDDGQHHHRGEHGQRDRVLAACDEPPAAREPSVRGRVRQQHRCRIGDHGVCDFVRYASRRFLTSSNTSAGQ